MSRVEVPVEIAAVVDELNGPEDIFENLVWRLWDVVERVLVHLEGHDIVGHGFVDVIELIDADLLSFDDVLPEFFIESDEALHGLVLVAVLDDDWFGAFLMISGVDSLWDLSVLQFELLHVRLNLSDVQQLLFLVGLIIDPSLRSRLPLRYLLLRANLLGTTSVFLMNDVGLRFHIPGFFVLSWHHIANIFLLVFFLADLGLDFLLGPTLLGGRESDLLFDLLEF